ncbi:hypothetical protein ACW50_15880 [Salmonella enterica subsp. enterica]|nr:hypothetical protein [Salmonella enterica subsp. enterica]
MAVNERLFREKLDYLRRYGKRIARENPWLEKLLASQGTDPGGGSVSADHDHQIDNRVLQQALLYGLLLRKVDW